MAPTSPHNHDASLKRCRLAVQQSALSKACAMLMQTAPPHVPNDDSAAEMRRLHPQPLQPVRLTPREQLPPAVTLQPQEIVVALRKYLFATSPGRDGLRSAVLKTIAIANTEHERERSALDEFTSFVNTVVNGNLPQQFHGPLAGGCLLGIPKPNSTGIRPIAIATLLRRFISRVLSFKMSRDPYLLVAYLLPSQLCVGVSGACEAIVHATRLVCNAMKERDLVVIQIDASNAFNNIDRQAILDEVTVRAPGIARWVHYVYGRPSPLFFSQYAIYSSNGSQQGDPLSLLLFSLALHPLLEDIKSRFGLRFLVFYADDGTIIIQRERAGEVAQYLEHRGKSRRFFINRIKTQAWWFNIPAHIPNFSGSIAQGTAIKVLGSPVGSDTTCKRILANRRQEKSKLLFMLATLLDAQLAFHLMRFGTSACRFVYVIRTTPPHITYAEAESFDIQQRSAFESIHRHMSAEAWKCATLPFKYGGLGLTKMSTIVEAGYVASVFTCWSFLRQLCSGWLTSQAYQMHLNREFGAPCSAMISRFSLPNIYTFNSLSHRARTSGYILHLQDEITDVIQGRLADDYMPPPNASSESDRLHRARCHSSSSSEAIRVFATVPAPSANTHSNPALWCTMIDLRFGNPIFNGQDQCPECLESRNHRTEQNSSELASAQDSSQDSGEMYITLDVHGYHASTCHRATGSNTRYNRIRNLLNVILRQPAIGLLPVVEWTFPGQEHLPWKQRNRLDLMVDDIAYHGERQGYDVKVVSPHNKNYTKEASVRAAGACNRAEQGKIRKYQSLCERDGIILTPIGIDVHGGVGTHARRASRHMAQYPADQKGTTFSTEYNKLTLRVITRTLQLTAAAVNSRVRQLARNRVSNSCDCSN